MTIFAALLALVVLMGASPGEAQEPGKVPRVGSLGPRTAADGAPYADAFRQGLRELGWIEGKNIVIEYVWAEGNLDRLQSLAADLVRRKVDVILAGNTQAAVAAKNATRTIPIVMGTTGDPVALGLVASLARPGANLPLQLLEIRGAADFESAFAAMARERAEALLVLPDSLFGFHRVRIQGLAATTRLPAMYGAREYVEAGGLMGYGVDVRDNFRRAAAYVDKILKGAKPAELPVEQPTKFELIINQRTATALGLKIPSSLLLRADEVIR